MFHELAPARSSNIVSDMLACKSKEFPSEICPPKSKTPLPSGDSTIALLYRAKGKDGPVEQNNQIVFFRVKF